MLSFTSQKTPIDCASQPKLAENGGFRDAGRQIVKPSHEKDVGSVAATLLRIVFEIAEGRHVAILGRMRRIVSVSKFTFIAFAVQPAAMRNNDPALILAFVDGLNYSTPK